MKKIKYFALGLTLAFNLFANAEQFTYDKNTVNLLHAVNACNKHFTRVLNSSEGISEVKAEYTPSSTPEAPDNQAYFITTHRGDFWGPTLSMRRHFLDGQWVTECAVAE